MMVWDGLTLCGLIVDSCRYIGNRLRLDLISNFLGRKWPDYYWAQLTDYLYIYCVDVFDNKRGIIILFYFCFKFNVQMEKPNFGRKIKKIPVFFQFQLDKILMWTRLTRGGPFKTQLGYLTTLLRLKQQKLSQFLINIIFK